MSLFDALFLTGLLVAAAAAAADVDLLDRLLAKLYEYHHNGLEILQGRNPYKASDD